MTQNNLAEAIVKYCLKHKSGSGQYRIPTIKVIRNYYDPNRPFLTDNVVLYNELISGMIKAGLVCADFCESEGIYKKLSVSDMQLKKIKTDFGLDTIELTESAVESILQKYTNVSDRRIIDAVEAIRKYRYSELKQHTPKTFMEQEKDEKRIPVYYDLLLNACCVLINSPEEMPVRNFSVAVFNDSKAFIKWFRPGIFGIMCHDLQKAGYSEQEMLSAIGLQANTEIILISGNCVLKGTGYKIDVSKFSEPVPLNISMVNDLVSAEASDIITVENLTTFTYWKNTSNSTVIYTGGYPSSAKIKLIRKIADSCHLQSIRHSGDIDAFGFDILKTIENKLNGIKVQSLLMDIDTYENNKTRAIEMTKANREKFEKMLESEEYTIAEKELFLLLLKENKTLEQEGI